MMNNTSGIAAVRFHCETPAKAVTYDLGLCNCFAKDCLNNLLIVGNDTDDLYDLLTVRLRDHSYHNISARFMNDHSYDCGELTVIEYDGIRGGRYRVDGEVAENAIIINDDQRLDGDQYERSERWLNNTRKINQIIDGNGFNHVSRGYSKLYLEKWNEQFNKLLKLDPTIGDYDHATIQFSNRWGVLFARTKTSFSVYSLNNFNERYEVQLLAVLSYLITAVHNEMASCTVIVPRWLIDGVHHAVRQYFVEAMQNTYCQVIIFTNDYSLTKFTNNAFEKRTQLDASEHQHHATIELERL